MSLSEKNKPLFSSFKDPSGFLYKKNGILLRQVNKKYKKNYTLLMQSGLYRQLDKLGLLVKHAEDSLDNKMDANAYKVIKPEIIPFISYPYEWCFSQLKDAALLTLKIQKIALAYNMSLKDASAYNIQFKAGKPLLIDTLSFEAYEEGRPWVAYRQFCQHFLAPLALAAAVDFRLIRLLQIYLDGIPLDLASKMLPKKTWLAFGLISHLHLHAKTQQRYKAKQINANKRLATLRKEKLLLLIDSLENTVNKLRWKTIASEWGNYYAKTSYSSAAFRHKKELVRKFLKTIKPKTVWDLGANTGEFSRIAAERRIPTIAFDLDPVAVESNYQQLRAKNEKNILPLILDLSNPSPALGWAHAERMSLYERGPADTLMALALIHHLAISNNLPFAHIAAYFSKLGKSLIIEFVPKSDIKVQQLLATREDIFDNYTRQNFEQKFNLYFQIVDRHKICESGRSLYLMQCKK